MTEVIHDTFPPPTVILSEAKDLGKNRMWVKCR